MDENKTDKMTYEQAMGRLENIVAELEGGSLPLEKSLKLFEEGTKLAAFCNRQLNQAELKITQVSEGCNNTEEQ